jgi:hypothetical protein
MAKSPRRQTRKASIANHDQPFSACRSTIVKLLAKNGLDLNRHIITSRDKSAKAFNKSLSIKSAPQGFTKSRLPFFMECEGVNFYISSAAPGVRVGTHSHEHGPVVRFVLEGSITFRNTEYSTGDWIYLPEGAKYSFEVGNRGASFILLYCCCC